MRDGFGISPRDVNVGITRGEDSSGNQTSNFGSSGLIFHNHNRSCGDYCHAVSGSAAHLYTSGVTFE